MDIKEKINDVYTRLQGLDIKPTKANMETLLQSLYDLRDVYNELDKEGEDVGRAANSSE